MLNSLAILAGLLLLLWLVLVLALLLGRPKGVGPLELLRLLPDTLLFLRRLHGDPELPRGVRVRLWFLLLYLALPFDLIPDFVPVLGQIDDALLIVIVLRGVLRRAGPDRIERHWPGSAGGLEALRRVAGAPLSA